MMNISCFLWRFITSTKLPHIGGALVWRQWRSLGWSNSYQGCCSLFHPWPFILFFIMDPPLFGKSPRCPTWKSTTGIVCGNGSTLYTCTILYHYMPPKKQTLAPSARRSAKAHGRTCPRGAPVWKMIKAAFNLGLWFLRGTPPNSHNTVLLWCPPIKQPFVVWCGWHY